MQSTVEGRQILVEKPLISTDALQIDALSELPEDTLGGAYARFMRHHGFSPDDRGLVRFIEDPEMAYVMARYRQVHDFWHVLCGLPISVRGELALKLFEFAQVRITLCSCNVQCTQLC
jgi:ubiquinone biosynthesis protein COQ4